METAGEEIDEFRLDHSHFSVARLIEERLRALECLPIPTKQPKAVDDAWP
jgi:hypothetical protein